MVLDVPSYKGNEPYAFVSYAHKDSTQVEKLLKCMNGCGLRCWYDDGIEGVTVWDDRIAEAVEKSAYFIAVMSKNYTNSDNCKDELRYARDLKKPILIIYIEDMQLSGGLGMRLNRNQALFFHHYRDIERFREKLLDCVGIQVCVDAQKTDTDADGKDAEEEPTISTYIDGFNRRVNGWLMNMRDKSIEKISSQRVKRLLIHAVEIEDRQSMRAARVAERMHDAMQAFGRGMLLYIKDYFRIGGKTRISSCKFVAKNIWLPLLAGIALFMLFAVARPGWLEIETLYADGDKQFTIYCAAMCIGTSLLWGAANGVMIHERRSEKTNGAEFIGYLGLMWFMTTGIALLIMTCMVYFEKMEFTSEDIYMLLTRKPDVIVFVTMILAHLVYGVWFILRADRER